MEVNALAAPSAQRHAWFRPLQPPDGRNQHAYGRAILSDQDRRERIRGLGSEQGDDTELGDVIGQLEMLLARLKAKS